MSLPPEKSKRPALGRGLSALLSETMEGGKRGVLEIPIARIQIPSHQPRTYFDPRSLEELKESIARYGLLQPLVVRELSDGFYELIAGERRLRALKLLGWEKAPAFLHQREDERIELALIENIQRENLTPIEEARAYLHLMDAFKLTQEELAERIKKSRPYVANKIRLLHLPEEIQELLLEGKLTEGHARALLALRSREEMIVLAHKILAGNLNVREVEERVRSAGRKKGSKEKEDERFRDPIVQAIEDTLGTPVKLERKRKGGILKILYHSEEKLQEIVSRITGN